MRLQGHTKQFQDALIMKVNAFWVDAADFLLTNGLEVSTFHSRICFTLALLNCVLNCLSCTYSKLLVDGAVANSGCWHIARHTPGYVAFNDRYEDSMMINDFVSKIKLNHFGIL